MSRTLSFNKQFYSNVIILSNKGIPLSTVSTRRASWYLRKNLGVEVPPPNGYPRAIKLNFTADVERPSFVHDLAVCKTQCVICGTSFDLTLHHVVPHVIRKHFPIEHKARARQWCVLMCLTHHMGLETDLKKIYYGDDFPHASRNKNTNITLQKIKAAGNLYRIPPEKMEDLLSKSDYASIQDIPILTSEVLSEHRQKCSERHNEAIKEWALQFVADHGGIEGTKTFFREHFLSYNPKYLPEGWLQELEVKKSA